jgi:hypothetical protein
VIDPQPDPHAVPAASVDQIEKEAVRGLEHLRQLLAQRHQLGDVEEPAPVALRVPQAPVGQPVRLPVEELDHQPGVPPGPAELSRRRGPGRDRKRPIEVPDDRAAAGSCSSA